MTAGAARGSSATQAFSDGGGACNDIGYHAPRDQTSGAVQHKPWLKCLLALFLPLLPMMAHPQTVPERLSWRTVEASSPLPAQAAIPVPALLPHSEPASGSRDIVRAWLADPTDRYPHDVLGDRLEAATLVAEIRDGTRLRFELPRNRVFEDLTVRLVDLDGDGRDEMLVVESDANQGASLAVFGVAEGRIVRLGATEFIGQRNRWLNPLGVGDFDGDGKIDVAIVVTPHIGGILRLYRFEGHQPVLFAENRGVSTHAIGSTELELGRVVRASPRDLIVIPEQRLDALQLLEWSPEGWQVHARIALPGRIGSSLRPVGEHRWQFELMDGRTLEVELHPYVLNQKAVRCAP